VLASEGENVNPGNSETCHPPYCIPCAHSATGLGTLPASYNFANGTAQHYCDKETGLCSTLYVCVPHVECKSATECSCSQKIGDDGVKYGCEKEVLANEKRTENFKGENVQGFISDAPYNNFIFPGNDYTPNTKLYSCCGFALIQPVCQLQKTTCKCMKGFQPFYSTKILDVNSFEGIDGIYI
jgi:hypothetical protein